jgi:hypothetical protein
MRPRNVEGAWWVVPVIVASYLGSIAIVAVQWGVWAGVAVWLMPPAAFGLIVLGSELFPAKDKPLVDPDELYRRLEAESVTSLDDVRDARRRHPAGWGKTVERPWK